MMKLVSGKCLKVFVNYQTSQLRTCKWNLLQHIVDNIEDVVFLEVLHGDFLKITINPFKTLDDLRQNAYISRYENQLRNKTAKLS